MFSLRNKTILLISPNHWGDMHISKHHYAKILAQKENNVYFLSPPSLNSPLFSIKEVEKNLWVINYYPLFRAKSILPSFIFNLLIKLQINFLLKKLKIKPDILWSFSSTLYYHLDWWKASLSIFHPMDQLNNKEAINIAKSSDIVFSCSNYILDEMSEIKTPKYYINHGVSPSYTNYEFPEVLENNPIQVGYVGNLFIENLDRLTLKNLISYHPEIHFNFYGAITPKESNISAWVRDESLDFVEFLKNAPNVTCHGVITSEQLPSMIKHIDVFLICYVSTQENLITNSHKILEYLSTGKTIVSSFVSHYKDSDLIEMCKKSSNDLYISKFENVITNLSDYNSTENQKKRKSFANKSSYITNVEKIESYLSQLVNK